MKKKTIILSVLIALVVIGGAVWALGGSKAKHQITYATAPVAKGEISESVTATGTIEPVTDRSPPRAPSSRSPKSKWARR